MVVESFLGAKVRPRCHCSLAAGPQHELAGSGMPPGRGSPAVWKPGAKLGCSCRRWGLCPPHPPSHPAFTLQAQEAKQIVRDAVESYTDLCVPCLGARGVVPGSRRVVGRLRGCWVLAPHPVPPPAPPLLPCRYVPKKLRH